MLKSKNNMLYITIGVFLIFSVIYFVTINKMSYAFSYDEKTTNYNNRIRLIELAATKYGENNLDLFDKEEAIYVTVDDLIANGYIIADDEKGNYNDPTSEVKILNKLKLRITYKDKKINVKLLER